MPRKDSRNSGLSGALDGGENCGGFGGSVDDVAGALAALLAHADIDRGQGERGCFHDAAGRVADHRVDLAEQAPIRHGVEVDEDVCVWARGRKSPRAFDEREASGVGVGIDEDKLAGRISERGEKGIGLGVGVAQDCDRVPGGEKRGRREGETQFCFEEFTAQERGTPQVVQRGRAGVVHAPRFLAHGDYAAARGFSRK